MRTAGDVRAAVGQEFLSALEGLWILPERQRDVHPGGRRAWPVARTPGQRQSYRMSLDIDFVFFFFVYARYHRFFLLLCQAMDFLKIGLFTLFLIEIFSQNVNSWKFK